MEKKMEIAAARSRRANMLAEIERLDCTQTRFAKLHNLSQPRMHVLLKQARRERAA